MSILALLIADSGASSQGLTPALAISSVIGFIILVLIISYSLRGKEAASPLPSEKSKELEGAARAQETERVFELSEKVEEAKAAPGLDQASDLLSAGLNKARERK